MRKNMKAILALCCIMAMVLTGIGIPTASAATTVDSLTVKNIFGGLGDAANYGIVAKKWYQQGHAESNACVDEVYKNSADPFANSENTYAHIYGSSVTATITAPSSLQGMTFALYKEEGTGYTLCAGTEKTVEDAATTATLTWKLESEMYNQQLHVFQVNGDGFVAEGAENSAGLQVNYGPAVFAGANNGNYLGKIIFSSYKGRGESLKVFNMTDFYPSLVLGPETRLYEMVGNEMVPLDQENKSGSRTVYVNYYYPDPSNPDNLLMDYIKLQDIRYTNGTFGRDGNIIYISEMEASEPGYASELVDNAKAYSKQLANIGGGTIDPEKGLTPNRTGSSTVTGPIDEDGNVVSIYDVEVGSDWNLTYQGDMGIAAMPVADNEYVIVNVICPNSGVDADGNRTETLYLSRNDAGGLNYFIEGKNGKVQCGWGTGHGDRGASQRVIYNIVYADENGVMQPYEGNIVPHNCHGGTILAPAAKLVTSAEVHNGAMIVEEVENPQEIHQRVLGAKDSKTWVIMNGGNLTLQKASVGYDWGSNQWQDMSGKVDLSGAVFGVYSDESCDEEYLVDTMETDETGKATSGLIAAGTYWIKEITPLKDHNLSTEVFEVTVVAGETAQVRPDGYSDRYNGYYHDIDGNWIWISGAKLVNQQNNGYASLRVLKNDEFGNVLQGAEFGVYTREWVSTGWGGGYYRYSLVASGSTNRNGVAIIENVPLSYQNVTYYVREIAAPDGYAVGSEEYIEFTLSPDDRDKIITVDGNGRAEGVAFTNTIIRGNLALRKTDSKTNANLAGAEFTVYSDKACTQVVGVMTTNNRGRATSQGIDNGKDLIPGTYYVKETKAPDGYMANDTVYTVKVEADKLVDVVTGNIITDASNATAITNDQAIHIYGQKVWYDTGYENNRPNEVKVGLYKGTQFLREVTVKAPDWKFEFLNLPRYDADGNVIEYSVRENLAGKSYDYYAYVDGIDGSGNVSIIVANSIRRVNITGEKAWEDGLDYDPDRPDTITFLLYQEVDGELVPMLNDQDQHMTTTGGQWNKYAFKFENLPFYDANGDEAVYVVKEAESDKYLLIETDVTENEEQNKKHLHFTLTNRMTVALNGAKVWQDSSNADGKRPNDVTLVLYRDGRRLPPREQPTITWDKATDTDVWTWSITGLPKYDENGNAYDYTVKEEPVPAGYTGTVSEDGLTFYNTKPGSIRLYKIYIDANGANQSLNGAEFKLYYDAACQNPVSDEVYVTSRVSPTRNGFIEITNLVPGDYYIREEKAPTGFVLPVPNDPIKVTVVAGQDARVNGDHGVVVNVPNSEAVTINVNKTWVGDEGKEDARPQSVTIQLYQNGTAMDGKTLELNVANNWSGEFTKLPNLDDGGNPYTYTVKETAVVPGYVGSVTGNVEDGFTVINTYNNTEITVTKKWEGPVSADDMGPVEVWLLANGVLVDATTLDVNNNWTHTFVDLPIADETGAEISYSVSENTQLADFSVTYTGDKDSGFVVTNTAKVGKITLTKVDAKSGKALKGAKFGIYSDEGCQTLVEEITTGDDGKATSGDLLPGTYYVKETEAPSGYKIVKTDAVAVTVVGDQTVQAIGDGKGGAFTNEQGKGKLYLKKVGTDSSNNNAQPLKDAEFTVYQYINGQKTEVGKIITDKNGYGEIALPIGEYMVQETKAPEGYKINDSSEKWVTIRAVDEEVWVKGGFSYNNEYGWFQNTSTAVGSIKLTKVSAKDANVKLQGAVFGVYSDQNCQNKVGEMTTDANGVATYAGLEANCTYYVKEITAPEGYELNTQVYSVLVVANTETAVNNGDPIPNEAVREKGAISLVKVSAVNAETKLQGAVFGVYSDESCTTKVGEMTTDANGAATFEGLYADETYWVKEIKAPSGYVLNEDKFSVTVVANTTTAVNNGEAITNEEQEGVATLYLYKVVMDAWGNTSGWLAGAEFTVYKNENGQKGEAVGTMTTNADGYAELSVPLGQFIVVETKAPEGYERDTSERQVQVNNIGDRVQVQGDKWYNGTNNCIGNKKQQTAFLELYKLGAEYDAEGNAIYSTLELLDGAEFTITANDSSIDPIVFTTVNGYAKVEVPVQKNLTIEETKAPEGYELTQGAKRNLWFNNADETVTLSWWGTDLQNASGSKYIYYESSLANSGALINKKIEQPEGGFKFTKQTVDGTALPGAVFGVYSEEACTTKLHELTTDKYGEASLTGLEAGKTYYIKEITAPTGYVLNETVYSVTIEANVDDKLVGDNGVITNTLKETEATFGFSKWISNYGDGELPVLDFVFDIVPLGEYDETMLAFKDGSPVDEAFTVTVKGDVAGEYIRTAFDLTIWKAGTYQFTVSERTDNVPDNWRYATNVYTVTIPVTEREDGSLEVGEVTYGDGLYMEPEFVNYYYKAITFYANKAWTNYNGEEDISLKLYYRLVQGWDENYGYIYGPWMAYPDSYEVELTKPDSAELGGEVCWEIKIDNLPQYLDNEAVDYGVAEVDLGGNYTVTYEDVNGDLITEDSNGLRVVPHGGTITNDLEATEVSVTKWWFHDGNSNAEAVDEDVTEALELYIRDADGNETLVTGADGVSPLRPVGDGETPEVYTWRGLKILPEGSEYIVREDTSKLPEGYVVTYNNPELDYSVDGGRVDNIYFKSSAAFWGSKFVDGENAKQVFTFELVDKLTGNVIDTQTNRVMDVPPEMDIDFPSHVILSVEYVGPEDMGKEYEYIIREVGNVDGYICDTTVYQVKVAISDEGEITEYLWDDAANQYVLMANAAEWPEKLVFNNKAATSVSVTKVWEGGVNAGADLTDSLQLCIRTVGSDGQEILTPVEDAVPTRSGDVYTWSNLLKYDEQGSLIVYVVREIDVPAGYTVSYETMIVGEDEGQEVTKDFALNGESITNTYAADGSVQLAGTKTLTGKALEAEDFSFELIDENGTVIEMVKNDANGKFTFTAIKYELADIGTHTYTVKEVNDKQAGITYDETVYTVTVEVKDAGNGTLTVTASDNATALDFTNTYAADGSAQFGGFKTLTGKELEDGEFTFVLTDAEGNELDKVQNAADGSFDFFTLRYDLDEVGNYTYYVKEVNDGKAGITYDETVYTVTVEVKDAGDGTLTVTASDTATALNFTNTYEAEGEITFAGVKTIEGRALTANDKFTFEIKEGEKTIATVENDADGKIAYPTIEYTLDDVGTHTYTVKETSENGNGITVDTTEYTVTVTVEDAGDGTLTVTASDNATALNFTNTYEATGEIVLEGTKTLVGRELAAGEFEFELIDEAGEVAATATNDAEGQITFTKLTYTTEDIGKTYIYTAKEVAGDLPGVTYDAAPITVKVTITDNGDGTLKVTKTVDSADIAFTNTYSAEGAILLAGTKSLTGRALKAGEFSFELYDANGELLQTVTNDAKGAIAFAEIKYELADAGKTFTYTVKEKSGTLPGVTYDDAVITVEVEVQDVGGKLIATLTQNSEAIAFTNTYEATGEITFEGTKTIEGRAMTADDLFTFEVKEGNDVLGLAMNDATGKIAYPTIKYTLNDVGTHTYTVRETNTDGDGITVDTTVHTVTVEVKDAGDGTLTVTASDNATALDFTNTYAADGKIAFSGTKTLTGKALEAEGFSFELIDENGTVIETVKNDANGKFTFTAIKYELADVGTHTYTVKEVNDKQAGVTYDETVYTVTVTVVDAGNGTLTVTASDSATALDFANTYAADGSVQFAGTKTLTGKTLAAEDFSFELIDEDGNVIETVKNDANGKFTFTAIKYELADIGTHTYTVKEVNDKQAGVTYDETVYTVTVEVKDAGDGTLTVTASDNATALDFTNTYAADGSVQFAGSKTLTGKALAAEDFSFELIAEDGTVIETVKNDADGKFTFTAIKYELADVGTHTYTVKEVNDGKAGVTYDATEYEVTVEVKDAGDGTLTVTASDNATALDFTNTYAADGSVQFAGTKTLTGKALAAEDFSFELIAEDGNVIETVKNDANGEFTFTEIKYELDDIGTHTYTVKEVNDKQAGVTYDETVYTVTVEVKDAGDGTLTVTASDNAIALDFTNTYAADGSVQFAGTKTLTGKALEGDDFSFELIDEDGTVIETVKNDANGKFTFTAIKYELADIGTHTYTVKEVNDGKAGITYDETVYTVTVEVKDAGDGTLTVTASDNATVLDFTNTYAADGSVQFGGFKTLTGKALEDGEFTFVLTDAEGNELDKAQNAADGSFDFFTLRYDLDDVGEYTYYVKEVNDKQAGITYDETVYTVTVTVVDAGDGKLTVTASDTATALNFTNTYEAEGEITFEGVKTIEGRALTENDKFTFEIKEGEKTIATVENDATGKIAYPTIEYTLADVGEHTYTVKETNENGNGITVDTTEYTVTVKVEDAGDGTLTVTASDNATALNFTNTYKATGEIVLEGTKTLVGRELAAGEFEFELIDEAGDVAATATNDAEGKITFTKLTYTTADIGKTYTYTAKEVTGNLPGVTYDAAPITVKVTITDNGDGTLNVVKTADSADIAFTNTYSAEGAILLAGTKSLTGRTLKADEFSFELYDANGELLQTATNDAKGAFAFEEIKYELADAGKTFTYTVKEKSGKLPGVTYDDAVITVEVKVEDVGGKLIATLTQNSEAIAFTNTYEATGEITFEGTKTIEGRAMTANDLFTFEVKEGNDVLGLAMNDATGKIAYPTIKYTLNDVGTHTYTVRETNTDGDGITVDTTVYTVTVEVKDAGDGTLTVTASDNATALDFTNTYAADGSVQFAGSKTLTGKALAAEDFSFELIAKDGTVIETVKNDANGKFTFTAIKYDLADVGEHTYTVKEVNDGKAGITYDATEYEVTVTVADAGNGTLTVTASDNATALDFTNTYAADGKIAFSGTKTLTGKTLAADDFSFELIGEDGNVIETVKNDANGEFTFTEIKYELADIGTHTYTVKEVNDKQAGITYDETVYTVTVEVKDAGNGTLTVTASDNAIALDFTNTYAADGSVQFAGSKTLTGKALAADDFSFELIDEDGTVIETVKNDADGKFTFTAIKYELDDIGTHTYTVKEVNDGKSGITYDVTEYEVTVEVKDAGNGTLTVTASDNATALDFTNTYAADGSVQFSGSKTLTGKALAAEDFSFELIAEDGTVIETVKNDANGKFAFTAIKYELADIGTHTYTVKEVNDGKAGVTYDETVYTVTVEVKDTGDGTLTVTASDNATELAFVNEYTANGELELSGTKTLTGKELEAGMFSFELIDAEGNVIETVENDAEGKFSFTAIGYTLADDGQSYTYKVREAAGNSSGVIYDGTIYTVKVEIADNGDGTLTVDPVISRLGEVVTEISFNNIMEAPLTISKKVVGCETDEKFAITVRFYHADGKEVTDPVAYTGDLTGEIMSGDRVFLGHGQSITFTGLLPGMRYTVEELANAAYETTVNTLPMSKVDGVCTEGGNRADFVNTLKTTTFSVTKRWDGEHGGVIMLTLYGNGEKLDPQPEYSRDGDVYTYTNLPMYNADGDLVVYSAKEKYVDGYLTIYDNVPPYDGESGMVYDGGTIINRSVTTIRVQKLWDGLAEGAELPEITLILYCNGEEMNRKQPRPDADGWYVYKNLPKYVNGELAEYRVLEDPMDGFVAVYTDPNGDPADWAEDGYTITNQLVPATGDNSPLALWAVMFTASAALLVLMFKRRRKAN